MSNGKRVRLSRLFHAVSGRSVIVPMDHGATLGPIPGLLDPVQSVVKLCRDPSQVQGLVMHRGVMEHVGGMLSPCDLPSRILHLSASTAASPRMAEKMLIASVEDALRMGADAVSIHVNLGVEAEPDMLRDLGLAASRCQQWGMPLLAMVYTRVNGQVSNMAPDLAHAARLAAEMGADLVKVGYPGNAECMAQVVDGCFIPVLIAGGEKCATDQHALQMVSGAMEGGAAGVCMGRNLFQQEHAAGFVQQVARIVHGAQSSPTLQSKRSALA